MGYWARLAQTRPFVLGGALTVAVAAISGLVGREVDGGAAIRMPTAAESSVRVALSAHDRPARPTVSPPSGRPDVGARRVRATAPRPSLQPKVVVSARASERDAGPRGTDSSPPARAAEPPASAAPPVRAGTEATETPAAELRPTDELPIASAVPELPPLPVVEVPGLPSVTVDTAPPLQRLPAVP